MLSVAINILATCPMKQDRLPPVRTYRALIVGALLIPPNLYWTMYAETVHSLFVFSVFTLFFNVVFTLFALTVLNTLLKKFNPKIAFDSSELLIVYTMLSIATGIFGHDLMLVMVQHMAGFGFATPENEWLVFYGRYVPHWLSVYDEQALHGYFSGGETFYTARYLNAWLFPCICWGGFLIVLLFVLVCVNTVIRKQWTENEKLSYPIIQLPLELTGTGAGTLSNRWLWYGFAIAGAISLHRILHAFFPEFPVLRTGYNLTPLFTTKPWNALRPYPAGGLFIEIEPFVVGLSYFLPLSLAFSTWFFLLFSKAELVFRSAIGIWGTPGPFRSYATAGAWMVVAVSALWMSRKHLKQVYTLARRPNADDKRGEEPMTYRTALIGIVCGTTALILFLAYVGIAVPIAVLFLTIYVLYALAIARIRAEVGPPAHDAEFMGPEQLILNALGARRVGQRSIAMFSCIYWMSRAYRSHPVGHQLEGFKIAQTVGAPSRQFLIAMLVASVVGTVCGFWVFLTTMYRYGAGNVAHNIGGEAFRRLEVWLKLLGTPEPFMLREVGLGAGITILLTALHRRFVGFPFHPVGYAVASGAMIHHLWFSILVAWTIKWSILKFGGIRRYRQMVPFFLGLVLGQVVVGCLGLILRIVFIE